MVNASNPPACPRMENSLSSPIKKPNPGGKQSSFTQILDKATGSVLVENGQSLRWMPKSNLAYYTRKGMKGTELVTLDPTSKKENILACQLPEGSFSFGPTEDYLLFSIREKGPQEQKRSKRYWCRMIANRDEKPYVYP